MGVRRGVARAVLAGLLALAGAPAGALGLASEVSAMMARGEHPAALERASRAASADPRDAQARFLVGVVLMEVGRDAEALAHFEAMVETWPELADPFNNIALLHARGGRLEPARVALERALRNDPRHAMARANLGQVHLMLAAQAWEAALAAGGAAADPQLPRRLAAVRELLKTPAPTGR